MIIRCCLFATVLFIALIGLIVVGQHQPKVRLLPGLDTCHGIPCYEGIELLKTSREEARTILSQLPGASWDDTSNRMSFSNGAIDWAELVANSQNYIFKITLHLRPGALSLGAVIQAWGIPCGIEDIPVEDTHPGFIDAKYYLEGDYQNNTLWIPTNDWILQPSSSVTGIDLNAPTNSIIDGFQVKNSCSLVRPQWKGFKNYSYR